MNNLHSLYSLSNSTVQNKINNKRTSKTNLNDTQSISIKHNIIRQQHSKNNNCKKLNNITKTKKQNLFNKLKINNKNNESKALISSIDDILNICETSSYIKSLNIPQEVNQVIKQYIQGALYKQINDNLWSISNNSSIKILKESQQLITGICKYGAYYDKPFFVYRNFSFTNSSPEILIYIDKLKTLGLGESIEFNSILSTSLISPILQTNISKLYTNNIVKILIPQNTNFFLISAVQREIIFAPCNLKKISNNSQHYIAEFEYISKLNSNILNALPKKIQKICVNVI